MRGDTIMSRNSVLISLCFGKYKASDRVRRALLYKRNVQRKLFSEEAAENIGSILLTGVLRFAFGGQNGFEELGGGQLTRLHNPQGYRVTHWGYD